MKYIPGCCKCGCPCGDFTVTVKRCTSTIAAPLLDHIKFEGCTVAIKSGAATVSSGTTDGEGVAVLCIPSAGPYSIQVDPPADAVGVRFAAKTVAAASYTCAAHAVTVVLDAATGYYCCAGSTATPRLKPVSKTLFLGTPNGVITVTLNAIGIGGGTVGAVVTPRTTQVGGAPKCVPPGSGSITVSYGVQCSQVTQDFRSINCVLLGDPPGYNYLEDGQAVGSQTGCSEAVTVALGDVAYAPISFSFTGTASPVVCPATPLTGSHSLSE